MKSILIASICLLTIKMAYAQTLFAPSGTIGISGNSNVGIGISNPRYRLHISSPDNQLMRFTSVNGTWLDFESTNAGVGSRIWTIGHAGISGNFGIAQRDGIDEYRLIVDKNGNVGIGTTSPSELLEIKGERPVISLQNTVDGTPAQAWIEFNDINSRMGYIGFGSPASNNLFLYNQAGGHTLVPSGYFGIGTGHGTPAAKLQIINQAQSSDGNTLILGSTSNGSANLRLGYNTGYSWIQSHGSKLADGFGDGLKVWLHIR